MGLPCQRPLMHLFILADASAMKRDPVDPKPWPLNPRSQSLKPNPAEVYVREGLGYEEEADDLKINLGEHLLRAVFARPASSAWVSQGASPSSQYAPQAFRTPT